ncbi:chloramphenicol phosphotransferase CPT family protein [Phaeobacter sp. B1627]|uniref:chloramphenicol phosphotransferase CPT family protein n=1 Tax=Phaeobacter sp. B1627 TaxID=2583809 RepID=UPI00111B144B|nr:AAA family ATPase [Phaeobacter sp. B1627]TNJ45105.1 chloramphenicol phosphotransferase [Phaeobacter sp. B1627]
MALILFLHGPSSSGKSTLATEIRKQATDRALLHLSIDHLRDSGVWTPSAYADWKTARPAFFSGFHRAIAGFATAGNDLILEHILDTPGWLSELRTLLAGQQLLFVGLHTPLATLVAREKERGDRPAGSAAADFERAHRGLSYDLIVDGTAPARSNAATILAALPQPGTQSRFFG